MNILPKKSWHVRNKDNIERVRRDEAQAAEEEKERQRRIALAESEARTDLLRKKSRKRGHEETEVVPATSSGHINFFEDLEGGKKEKKGNAEYEAEKKEEKEKHEKALGILTYLGQSAIESQTSKPWYSKTREKHKKNEEKTSKHVEEFNSKGKRSLDPIKSMTKFIAQTERFQDHRHGREKDKYSERDRKIEKRRLESSGKINSPSAASSAQTGPKTIEQLRAERLKREQEERMKTEKLMAKFRGEKLQDEERIDERRSGYNSQFNPELARRRKRDYD